jgi:serine/threonine protein kinase
MSLTAPPIGTVGSKPLVWFEGGTAISSNQQVDSYTHDVRSRKMPNLLLGVFGGGVLAASLFLGAKSKRPLDLLVRLTGFRLDPGGRLVGRLALPKQLIQFEEGRFIVGRPLQADSVWEAVDRLTGGTVILKIDRMDPEAIERISRINSPHVVSLLGDWVNSYGQPLIVMEKLEGETLHNVLVRERHLPLGRAVDLFDDLLKGVVDCHREGVYRLDIAPKNVFCLRDDRLLLFDFDSARVVGFPTHEGKVYVVIGTEGYVAPEVLLQTVPLDTGAHGDFREEIFALGATFYKIVTGKGAFPEMPDPFADIIARDNALAAYRILRAPLREEIPHYDWYPPGAVEELDRIIRQCLRYNPDDRYESVEALRRTLLAWKAKWINLGLMSALL